MRAIWKGSISFGLVHIPIALYSATKPAREIKFRLLRSKDLSPIRYKRVAEADEKETPWNEIVKGFEFDKDRFVTVTDADFERVNIKSNQTVDIQEFVDLSEIDPMFFDVPYFLAPEKGGAKAYVLLREALEQTGKVGIAKVVLKTREHLAAVKPLRQALMLELMHFADELADPSILNLPADAEVSKKELEMATSLVQGMSDSWKPEKYRDEYSEAMMKVIEEKIAAGGKAPSARKQKLAQPTNVVDLVEILQRSLAHTKGRKTESPAKKRKAG